VPSRLVLTIGWVLSALALSLPAPRPAGAAGSVTSQGDRILRADLARSTFGVTGAGVRVGVISTGIQGLDTAKATANLPAGTCGPRSGGTTSIDANLCRGFGVAVDTDPEGTAMMEIIHDLAPGAELLFCAPGTSLDMVDCIDFLAARTHIIVDDLGFFAEPYFEDGMVAAAAARARHLHRGVAHQLLEAVLAGLAGVLEERHCSPHEAAAATIPRRLKAQCSTDATALFTPRISAACLRRTRSGTYP